MRLTRLSCIGYLPVGIACLLCLAGCQSQSPSLNAMSPEDKQEQRQRPQGGPVSAASLSNRDVTWDGNLLGLTPSLSERARAFLNHYPESGDAQMLESLADEDRYVLGHVILSMKHGQSFPSDGDHWNGLRVVLKADGSSEYAPGQRADLERRWREALDGEP
jgi:hypothetical protein